MKNVLLAISVLFCLPLFAQRYEKFYNWQWRPCEAGEARFYSLVEKKDSTWLRKDYFIHENSLQMQGTYQDSLCKTPHGKFHYYFPNRNLKDAGQYHLGKKMGTWLSFHGLL